MKLSDRIKQAREEQAVEEQQVRQPTTTARIQRGDPLAEFKRQVQQALFAKLGPQALDPTLSEGRLKRMVIDQLEGLIAEGGAPLTPAERERIAADISRDILGLGPVEPFLADSAVTEIMVNGTDSIYIERDGRLYRTKDRFLTEEHLRRVIDRIVSKIGRRIDESSPMVDARLADGSRVNAVIPPLSVDGPLLTIRKFSKDPYQVDDLIRFGTLTQQIAELTEACVEGRLNILITGGTGTGKTTLLNVFSGFIPDDHRIVTIEDAVELQLHQDHVARLEYRPPNIEGKGEVTIRDLVRNSLRMRPDRIIVGEVRGGEALDMLQAMNTGHEGSMSTLHANTPRDGLNRLETMVMMAGTELPVRAIREYIASALSLIVHLTRMKDGSRRVTSITEVVGMEGDLITLQEIYRFKYAGRIDEEGRVVGKIEPTGIRPNFADHFSDIGIALPKGVFDGDGTMR
jgi:pilus assembly protein CpaF